jgi:hypothetical protein
MIQSYKTLSVHIDDQGLFPEIARTLSKSFGRVTYTSPWVSGFPFSKDIEVGEGMAEYERVEDIADVIDETDLFVFPDIYKGPMQEYLRKIGKRVWGSFRADEIEIYRSEAKPVFKKLGIPQGPYEIVEGINGLRKYIKSRGNTKLWVKIDKTRGDTETFPTENYELAKNILDDFEARLGPKADIMKFTVEDHLEGTIDLAIDTHCVDGNYPGIVLLGTEEKGECYICVRKKWTETPESLRDIYYKLSPIFKDAGYRNFLSLESRQKGKVSFLGDPCCRAGSPPLELELNMIDNLPDIMYYGAEGRLIDPEIASLCGLEICVHSDWSDKHPLLVEYPASVRDKIKFRYNSEFNGKTWIMPQGAGPRMAAIVVHGSNLDTLFGEAEDIAGKLKGNQIETFTRSFKIALDKIEQLKKSGVKF